ncbi:hypothetical protein M378DRAFT_161796 [Amanita muscaria Koide BX008]|uniref:Uncharacterized protein n=1 Tax=Amanita muscaria (strain Koide BX008) TaxID=946122 RepID=A0A0C2SR56_AMAMK|nr:hypothetical protein M378DRAFT_161796 [Amanita muscaria Koide BX008]
MDVAPLIAACRNVNRNSRKSHESHSRCCISAVIRVGRERVTSFIIRVLEVASRKVDKTNETRTATRDTKHI